VDQALKLRLARSYAPPVVFAVVNQLSDLLAVSPAELFGNLLVL
jgi:hypothetical protein